ncbi:MAG: hypothetical protein QGH51_03965 [Planctomycetota bacterium]|nr:hypothetical protein [Planctomycetota bacterium]
MTGTFQDPSSDLIFEAPETHTEWEQLLNNCENAEELAWVYASVLIPGSSLEWSDEIRKEAPARILDWLLLNDEGEENPALRLRLRGWVSEEGYQRCANALLSTDSFVNRGPNSALDILLEGPWSETRAFHQSLALHPSANHFARARLLKKWVTAEGRNAVLQAANALLAEENHGLLKSLLMAWEKVWTPSDAHLLNEIISESTDEVAQGARLLLARHSVDFSMRAQLFLEAQKLEANRRNSITASLALQGPHSEIAARLSANLQSSNEEQREYSERFLPGFLKPEDLWKEYVLRLDSNAHPLSRARCMVTLARVPIPQARAIAGEWLVGGGWRYATHARSVSRELVQDPQVDSILPSLFSIDELPIEVGFPLAIARAEYSEFAREWLRKLSWVGEDARELQALETLAKVSEHSDLPYLLAVAQDATLGSGMRAAAISGISRHDVGREELLDWLKSSTQDFEILDAIVRELVLRGTLSDRQQIRSFIRELEEEAKKSGATEEQASESFSLRLGFWQSQESRPLLGEQKILESELIAELLDSEDLFSEGLPEVRRLASEFPRVHFVARALGAHFRKFESKLSENFENYITAAPVAPVLHALFALPSGSAWKAAHALSERTGLSSSIRLRALANLCAHSFFESTEAYRDSLAGLLEETKSLRAYPWDLSAGLRSEDSISWVLPADRLNRELLVTELFGASTKKKLEMSSRLLNGFTSPSRLLSAARVLRQENIQDSALRRLSKVVLLRLCHRAKDWAPTDSRPYLELGRTHLIFGEVLQARMAFESALRLAPPDSDWAHEAQEGLQASAH